MHTIKDSLGKTKSYPVEKSFRIISLIVLNILSNVGKNNNNNNIPIF